MDLKNGFPPKCSCGRVTKKKGDISEFIQIGSSRPSAVGP